MCDNVINTKNRAGCTTMLVQELSNYLLGEFNVADLTSSSLAPLNLHISYQALHHHQQSINGVCNFDASHLSAPNLIKSQY